MEIINSLDEIQKLKEENTILLLYFSTDYCNVCKTLKPKLEELLKEFPEVKSVFVNLEKLTEASGMFTVFTIPTINRYD